MLRRGLALLNPTSIFDRHARAAERYRRRGLEPAIGRDFGLPQQ